MRKLRLVVPNAFTCLSLVFALYAIERALRGQLVDAIWWNLICVGTDKLDGAAAKALDAGSSFGMQLDSLADLVSFGVSPATLFLAYFGPRWPAIPLFALCAMWLIAVAIRLARFNVAGPQSHYLGTPSTMAAGMLLTAFLSVLKYAGSDQPWRILPLDTRAWIDYVPLLLIVGAAGMLSPLKVPKLGRTRNKLTTILLLVAVAVGFVFGLLRLMPEYLFAGGLVWIAVSFAYRVKPSA
jgi:CDP-diacylglycerol---serine O-phosphatidyltransferase